MRNRSASTLASSINLTNFTLSSDEISGISSSFVKFVLHNLSNSSFISLILAIVFYLNG